MQKHLFSDISGATFSPCDRYRYTLWRTWDKPKGLCMFLMLNPSTADESANDPTVERCQRYAHSWGYGGLIVCNLFALRATDPGVMLTDSEPVGPDNNAAILECAGRSDIVVCAWGNHGSHQDRARYVADMLQIEGHKLHSLVVTSNGHPGHPLYLRKSLKPSPWQSSQIVS
jgi:hypothetical protein